VAQKTLIDGQVYFDRQKDIDGRAALAKEKQDLIDKEKKAAEEKKPDDSSGAKKPDPKKKGAKPTAAAEGISLGGAR
jgi:hypothetical protein